MHIFHFEVFIRELGVALEAGLTHEFSRFLNGWGTCDQVNNAAKKKEKARYDELMVSMD